MQALDSVESHFQLYNIHSGRRSLLLPRHFYLLHSNMAQAGTVDRHTLNERYQSSVCCPDENGAGDNDFQ